MSSEDLRQTRDFARSSHSVSTEPRSFPYEFRVAVPAQQVERSSLPVSLARGQKESEDVGEIDISKVRISNKSDFELTSLSFVESGAVRALPGCSLALRI